MTASAALEAATSFDDLGLAPEILQAIRELGYTAPTPIQRQAIPLVLSGHDLMAQAQTGTGKTAAFALPLIQRMRPFANTSTSPARHPVRALVLTPTRELAIQVHASIAAYGKYLPLRSAVVYGGVALDSQEAALRAGVEILVATPGRLLDHAANRSVQLNQVQFLVLDEADRMLDMGFLPDLRRILALLPQRRQTLLFSATFSDEVSRLAQSYLSNPLKVEVARRNTAAETVEQVVHKVGEEDKLDALINVIRARALPQALVFTRTKLAADRLGRRLKRRGLAVAVIHGDKAQIDRLAALEGFKQGHIKLLVATDIAARGLDIAELPCVVNYELPNSPEDYVHRIGRTGRAGARGLAISLVSPEEDKLLAAVERFIRRSLPISPLPRAEPARREPSGGEQAVLLGATRPRRPAPDVCALLLPPVARKDDAPGA